MKYDLFISYHGKSGRQLACKAKKILEEKYLISIFFATENLRIGDHLKPELKKAIEKSCNILVILTKGAVKSKWVKLEVEHARKIKKNRIIYCVGNGVSGSEKYKEWEVGNSVYCKENDLINKLQSDINWRMPVVLPVGGKGIGMLPLTLGMPKILLPIGNKPMLHYIISTLDSNKFSRVIVLSNYYDSMIKDYGKPADCEIDLDYKHVENGQTLIGAVKKLNLKCSFLYHHGDIILYYNDKNAIDWCTFWSQFIDAHKQNKIINNKYIGTLLTSDKYKPSVGYIQLEKGELFFKKPVNQDDNLMKETKFTFNIGISIFEPELIELLNEKDSNVYDENVMKKVIRKKKYFHCHIYKGNWKHIQTTSDWFAAQKEFLDEKELPHLIRGI